MRGGGGEEVVRGEDNIFEDEKSNKISQFNRLTAISVRPFYRDYLALLI